MATQYPSFRADPNAVPNRPGLISGLQKGYLMAQLPEKLKRQKALQAAQTAKAQAQAHLYEGQASIYDPHALDALRQKYAPPTGDTQPQQAGMPPPQMQQQTGMPPPQQGRMPAPQQGGMPPPQMQQQGGMPPPQMQQQGGMPPPQMQQPQQGAPQGAPVPGQIAPQQQAPPSYYGGGQQQRPDGGTQVITPGNPNLRYLDMGLNDADYAEKLALMGVKKKTQTNISPDGNITTVTTLPSGKVTSRTIRTGDTPAQSAFNVAEAKKRSATIGKYQDNLQSNVEITDILDQMEPLVLDPNLKNAVGPLNSPANLKLGLGSQKVQDLTGRMDTFTTSLQAKMATGFKSRVTNFMIKFVKGAKPSVTDPAAVFVGKYDAARQVQEFDKAYNTSVIHLMRQGYNREDAIAKSEKDLDWKGFQKNTQSILDNMNNATAFSKNHKDVKITRGKDNAFVAHFPDADGIDQTIPLSQYEAYMKQMRAS